MEQNELIAFISDKLRQLNVAHYLTDSVASSLFGESRTTNDIDLVADLRPEHVDALLRELPSHQFYASRDAMLQAVRSGSQFNIIDTDSFIKVDVIIPRRGAESEQRLRRRQELAIAPGVRVPVASPEDVIVMKLVYHQEGASERQLRDVIGILQNQRLQLDHQYILTSARAMEVEQVWETVLARWAEGGT